MTFFFLLLGNQTKKEKKLKLSTSKKKRKKSSKITFSFPFLSFSLQQKTHRQKNHFFSFHFSTTKQSVRERERERYGQGKWKSRRTLCFSNATPGLRAKSPSRQSWIRSCTRIRWKSCWLKGRNIWRTWAWLICVWGIEKTAPFS